MWLFLIPWFIRILKILILPWRKLFRLLGLRISLIYWNKSKRLLLHCRDEMYNLASSFSFWLQWRKSWRVNLHVGSLFDLWKVMCTIVRSLSDVTITPMIATDEEHFSSKSAVLLSVTAPIQRFTHLKKTNRLYQSLKNDIDCWLTAQFSKVKLL